MSALMAAARATRRRIARRLPQSFVDPMRLSWNATARRYTAARVDRAKRQQRARIQQHVVAAAGGLVVAEGPFAGLRYVEGRSWQWCVPYLIGGYELELHPWLERLVATSPRHVIDIGCAEGYYAVGMARRLQTADVYAFDIDERAQALCREVAALNGVADRVAVRGECTHEDLARLCGPEALLMLDCEGAELDLLNPEKAPALAATTILVELHDFVDARISPAILSRFEATHAAELVGTVARPHGQWRVLRGLDFDDRFEAMHEHRPAPMRWALLTPR